MLVGENLLLSQVLELLMPLEAPLGRKINPVCYTPAEFARRRAEPDSFINRVLAQPVHVVRFCGRCRHRLSEWAQLPVSRASTP